MTKRQISTLACTAVVAASVLGAAPSAAATSLHMVFPGQSVQAAIDAARPGDTVFLTPGVFRESVRITTSGLTLRGSGRTTVLMPAATPTGACATAGHGLCVEGTGAAPVKDTAVRSLTLAGFKKNGLWASRTDRLSVRGVTAENNGQWGIATERSIHGVLRGNTARGNGDAGVFVANTVDTEQGATDTGGTVIRDNLLTGNRIGVTVRRLRNLVVEHNDITTNCAGVFVVGDESKPRAGALTVRGNHVHENNSYCPKTPRLPFLQGSGIVLTGAEETRVTQNLVVGNQGASPLSGGIVLFKSLVGALNERNTVSGNVVHGNTPADLVDGDTGTGNTFAANLCAGSRPAGLC